MHCDAGSVVVPSAFTVGFTVAFTVTRRDDKVTVFEAPHSTPALILRDLTVKTVEN